MGDYKLPELPSDEELGITDADRELLEDDGPAAADAPGDETLKGRAAEPPAGQPPKGSGPLPTTEPRNRWKGPLTLVLLVAAAWISSPRTGLPRPVPANAPDTAFSSARAMSMLVEVASDAHPTGSPEHARVRGYLLDRLRSMGLEPEVQTTTSMIEVPEAVRSATVRNVVARLPGTASTGAILLTAHYDSRGISRGAGDDGSGVVTILEAVRALRAGEPIRNDVIVLFTDGEELGLLGARAFVAEHPWMPDVSVVLSFEMRGAGGPSIMFETKEQNGWILQALDAFATHPVAYSLSSEVYERLPNDTDFTPFEDAGVQGLNFAAIGRPHVYHQEYDAPANVSESTIQHHGLYALGALHYLGAAELGAVDGPNVVYFTVPVLGLMVYAQWWVLVMGGTLLLALAAAVVLARRGGARASGLVAGLGVAVLGGALSFGVALLLSRWLPRFHAEHGSLMAGQYHAEGWYVTALLGAVFALVTATHALARRWLSPTELAIGALALPLLGAVVLSVAMPLAAPNLQWPSLAAVVAAMVFTLTGPRVRATAGWAAAVVLAAFVLAFMVPLIELSWVAMSFEAAGLLAALMATALYLCLPALDDLRDPNAWWAPLTGLVVGGVALAVGILSARPSDERPAPSTLAYAYEHGTGAAMWVTDAALGTRDEDAHAWAVERAGSEFGGTRELSEFGYLAGEVPVTTAPVVSAAPPSVTVRSDAERGGTRRVTLAVRSEIGAEVLRFEPAEDGDTRLVSLNGRALAAPGTLEWADHWGVPDSAVMLELEMPASTPIDLFIVEHLLRPEELLGAGAFARPPDLAPDVTRLSDRAMFRFSVAAFADPRYGLIRRPAGPGAPVPDTAAVAPDTATVVPDTAGTVPDTVAPVPDSAGAQGLR
jgi:MFS family permease